MINLPCQNHSPNTNKIQQLNQKMLGLADELLVQELEAETVIACGQLFTNSLTGKFGRYETLNGEVIAFQPNFNINFILICDEFVVTSTLPMIKTIVRQVDDYELMIEAQ